MLICPEAPNHGESDHMKALARKVALWGVGLGTTLAVAPEVMATTLNVTTQAGQQVLAYSEAASIDTGMCLVTSGAPPLSVAPAPSNGTTSQDVVTQLLGNLAPGPCPGDPTLVPVARIFYTPNAGFAGTDSFGVLGSQFPNLTINVNVTGEQIQEQQSGVKEILENTADTQVRRITATVIDRIRRARRQNLQRTQETRNDDAGIAVADNAYGGDSVPPPGQAMLPLLGYGSGYAAGNDTLRWGVWANGGHTWVDNDFANTAFDGTIISALAGVDYWVTDKLLLGGFGGYEAADIDTGFNRGEVDSDGFTGGIYGAYILSRNFTFEAQFGFTRSDTDTTRSAGVVAPVTGSTDSDRFFGAAGFTGEFTIGNFLVGPTVRHILAHETADAFTESDGTRVSEENVDLGLLQVGGRAGYDFGIAEPFVSLLMEIETITTETKVAVGEKPRNDRASGDLTAGVNFYPSDFISGGVEVNHKFERENLDETTVSGNITFAF
jgi:hypothetical protein